MNAVALLHPPPPMNVYVHGTYRSGQCTCHPDRVVLIVGCGGGTGGEEGKRVLSVAVTSLAKSSMCAGFR